MEIGDTVLRKHKKARYLYKVRGIRESGGAVIAILQRVRADGVLLQSKRVTVLDSEGNSRLYELAS